MLRNLAQRLGPWGSLPACSAALGAACPSSSALLPWLRPAAAAGQAAWYSTEQFRVSARRRGWGGRAGVLRRRRRHCRCRCLPPPAASFSAALAQLRQIQHPNLLQKHVYNAHPASLEFQRQPAEELRQEAERG